MSEIKLLTAKEIFAAKDLGTDLVEIPEWGGKVMIKELNSADRDWLEASMLVDAQSGKSELTLKGKKGREFGAELFRAKLVILSVVDPESHKRIFATEDLEELSEKSAKAISKIADAATRLNGLGDEEVKNLGEECERVAEEDSDSDSLSNSDAQSENSNTDSPQEN
jgi:hypothetical protein